MSEKRPGLLLVHDSTGVDSWLESVANRLRELGFAVSTPKIHPEGQVSDPLPDRETNRLLETALVELGSREAVENKRLAVVGFGTGGTYAFLLGCLSHKLSAVVIFEAPLIRTELSSDRPVQPLELALNFSVPLLAIFTGGNQAANEEHWARLRVLGSQFALDFDIVTYPESPREAYRAFGGDGEVGADVTDAWRRTVEFLSKQLELRDLS